MATQRDSTRQLGRWPFVLFAWCILGLAGAALAAEESAELRISHRDGATSRVTIVLQVSGTLRQEVQIASQADVPSAEPVEKMMEFPLNVNGRLMYDEVSRGGRGTNAFSPQSVRQYLHCEAKVQVGKHSDQIKLREPRRTVMATDEGLLCSIDGPITREELDLIEVPGNSLIVDRLLPNRQVRIGEKWTPRNEVIASLVNCDQVSAGDVTCQLTQISNGLAIVTLTGSVTATAASAETSIELSGEYRYDIRWGRITWLELNTKEDRQSGLVQPGFDVTADLRMRIEPLKQSTLSAGVVESAWQANPKLRALLLLKPRSSAIELTHDRRWHLTGDFPRRTVMRCLDKGQLLAQLNVTELPELPAGRELSLAEFQSEIRAALGDRFREFVSATKEQSADGNDLLRVVAVGIVDDIPIHWVYYHIGDESGRRAAHVYILESENLEEFADVDREMVAGFRFAPRHESNDTKPAITAAKPNSAQSTSNGALRRNNQAQLQSQPVR